MGEEMPMDNVTCSPADTTEREGGENSNLSWLRHQSKKIHKKATALKMQRA
jgi:hypothetical protein